MGKINFKHLKSLALNGRTPADRIGAPLGVYERDRIAGLDGWRNGVKIGLLKGEDRIRIICKWYGILGEMGADNIFHFHEEAQRYSYGIFDKLFTLCLFRRHGIPYLCHRIYYGYSTKMDRDNAVWLRPGLQFDVIDRKILNSSGPPAKVVDKQQQERVRRIAREVYIRFFPLYEFYRDIPPQWGYGKELLDKLEYPEKVTVTEELIAQLKRRWKTPRALQAAFKRHMWSKYNVVTYKESV